MADCKTVSYPLVINGENEGVFIPVLLKKIKKKFALPGGSAIKLLFGSSIRKSKKYD